MLALAEVDNNLNGSLPYEISLLEDLGKMSAKMKMLAISQDKIGWINFIEGRISELFYDIQCVHLAMPEKIYIELNGPS